MVELFKFKRNKIPKDFKIHSNIFKHFHIQTFSNPYTTHRILNPFSMQTFQLPSNLFLRIRAPGFNTNGSILLSTPEGIWECVESRQSTNMHYTGDGWVEKMCFLFGNMDEEEKTQMFKENEAKKIKMYRCLRGLDMTVTNQNSCKLFDNKIKIADNKWSASDGSLELFTTNEIDESCKTIKGTEYTSILLKFELVTFEDQPGLKRTRSDST